MDLFEALSLALSCVTLLLLVLFLVGIRAFFQRITPLLDQFTNNKGGFELPKINMKQALGYGLYKLFDSMDFSKGLQGLMGGKKS